MKVFGPGSIAMRIYPHTELGVPDLVTEMLAQARLAVERGFDGVMLAEQHDGFGGYLPDPLQLARWLLADLPGGWVSPGPMILPLRPAVPLAAEVARLGARFPGRVGLGVCAGSQTADFALLGVPTGDLTHRFDRGLAELAAALRGDSSSIAGSSAIAESAPAPVPLVCGTTSGAGARRAARLKAGLFFDASTRPGRIRQLTDAYRAEGGNGPRCLMRAVWLGPKPAGSAHWPRTDVLSFPDPAEVANRVAEGLWASGTDSVNLRVHFAGVTPELAREQIVRLGQEVVPRLRRTIAPIPDQSRFRA